MTARSAIMCPVFCIAEIPSQVVNSGLFREWSKYGVERNMTALIYAILI